MIWPSVIGQERAKKHLLELVSRNRLAHAYLFEGDEGVGKDALALQLARVIHCDQGKSEPCGTCPSCLKSEKLQHPDIHLVFALPVGTHEVRGDGPMEKLTQEDVNSVREQLRIKAADPYHVMTIPRANVIKLSSIRELRRESSLSLAGTKRRVVVISRADEMNEESSNALLKTLEEPSTETTFILTTAHPDRLLPTIRSRCHVLRLDLLSSEEIKRALERSAPVSGENAELVAHLALGSYTRALGLLTEDIAAERRRVVEFVRLVLGGSFVKLMERIDELSASKDRDLIVRFLNLITVWFRDVLVLREGCTILNIDQRADLESFLAKFPDVDVPPILDEVNRTVSLVERNGYIPLALVRLSIRLKRMILAANK